MDVDNFGVVFSLDLSGQAINSHFGCGIRPALGEPFVDGGRRGQYDFAAARGLPVGQNSREDFGWRVDVLFHHVLESFGKSISTNSFVTGIATVQKERSAKCLCML